MHLMLECEAHLGIFVFESQTRCGVGHQNVVCAVERTLLYALDRERCRCARNGCGQGVGCVVGECTVAHRGDVGGEFGVVTLRVEDLERLGVEYVSRAIRCPYGDLVIIAPGGRESILGYRGTTLCRSALDRNAHFTFGGVDGRCFELFARNEQQAQCGQ